MHKIQRTLSRRRTLLLRLGAVVLTLATTAGLLSQAALAQTTYVITDGDRVVVHTTYTTDPAAVLTEAGLELGAEDTYTAQSDGGVAEITVNRLQLVTVNWNGEATEIATYGATVSQILAQLSLPQDQDLRISQPLDAQTHDGMVIDVVRLAEKVVEYTRAEPFETIYCTDSTLAPGEERVVVPGKAGSVLCTALVSYADGQEVSRTVTSEVMVRSPVTAVIAQGIDRSNKTQTGAGRAYVEEEPAQATAPAEQQAEAPKEEPEEAPKEESKEEPAASGNTFTTASGEVITYVKKLSVEATAYSCEGYQGITATGTVARYGAIAVDPTVIPYGTRMYIVSDDGAYIYGYATAEDCGGGIKGNKIDLYFDTVDECWEFGRRACTVYILE